MRSYLRPVALAAAALGASFLTGPASAQSAPEGVVVIASLPGEDMVETHIYTFEPGGVLSLRREQHFEERLAIRRLPGGRAGAWSRGDDGSVTVQWDTGEIRQCESWPAYSQTGPLDAVETGTCWLSDALLEHVSRNLPTRVY